MTTVDRRNGRVKPRILRRVDPFDALKFEPRSVTDEQRVAREFHALTDRRDPPDPKDVAWEELRLADLAAGAETTRENIAESERQLGGLTWPDPDAPDTTFRTLADVDDTPPGPLLLGMLEPDGPNLMYALGGTGKGTTGAWMCGELIAQSMRPMVYDAENRPREWARRTSGLGIDRSRVVYVQPRDLPPKLLGRPLWDVAEHLGRIAHVSGADLLMIDSVLPAVGVGEERLRSDAQVPYLYVASLDALSIPSLSFGHPPKGQPEGEPFGSVAWVNAMRMTWNGTKADGEGHRIRWRSRKKNERGYLAPVLLSVEYGQDGRPCAVVRQDDETATREWLLLVLDEGPQAVSDLAEQIADETEDAQPGEVERVKVRIRQTLLRMSKEGIVQKVGRGHATRWERAFTTRVHVAGRVAK